MVILLVYGACAILTLRHSDLLLRVELVGFLFHLRALQHLSAFLVAALSPVDVAGQNLIAPVVGGAEFGGLTGVRAHTSRNEFISYGDSLL